MAVDLDLRIGGAPQTRQAVAVIRELRPEDLMLLDANRKVQPTQVKALRARHHTLARLIAEGRPLKHCAAITGYTASRISILQADHSFRQLVRFYAAQVEDAFIDTQAAMAELSKDAIDIIRERLEDRPEDVTNGFLLELLKTTADRTGHGPTATQVTNINVGFADRLELARKRANVKVIEATKEDYSGG